MADLFSTGIRPSIDAYLKAKSEEVRSYGDYWSASSAGYCMRLNIMRRLKIPKVPELEDNATQTRIFEAGHIFHEWMQRITKNAGLSIASEVELQDEDLMIRGHFDDLVLVGERYSVPEPNLYERLPLGAGVQRQREHVEWLKARTKHINDTQHLILYDYKTQNSAAFTWQKKQPRPISHYHKYQLGTYMYMLRKANKKEQYWPTNGGLPELTESRILKLSKDDLRMSEDQLLYTPDLEKDVVGYWNTLNGYWKAKKLPRCTCLDNEGGFMGRRSAKSKIYNDFFWDEIPCNIEWAKQFPDKIEGWAL